MDRFEIEFALHQKYVSNVHWTKEQTPTTLGHCTVVKGYLHLMTKFGMATEHFEVTMLYDDVVQAYVAVSSKARFGPHAGIWGFDKAVFNEEWEDSTHCYDPNWETVAASSILFCLKAFNKEAAKDPCFAPRPGVHELDVVRSQWDV